MSFAPGMKSDVIDKFLGYNEHTKSDKPYRLFVGRTLSNFINQRNELVCQADSGRVIIATPPSKQVKGKMNMYKDIKRHVFTQRRDGRDLSRL